MSKKNLMVGRRIGGKFFDSYTYDNLLLSFKDSFSRASLSVELAFNHLEEVEMEYDSIKSQLAYDLYQFSDRKDRNFIDDKMKYFIVFYGHKVGILNGAFDFNEPQKNINKKFEDNFQFMFDDMHYILEFDNQGKFLEKETFRNVGNFFSLIFEKKRSEEVAVNMQKDNMDAFDYAMKLDDISIDEIIKINAMVNNSDPNKEVGFKKTNNDIIGASFEVADKTTVPTRMVELLAEYKNNFGMEILDPSEYGISYEERTDRLQKLFKKEAIFHIKFERIHPFADGNGRTGRILMNKHLMEANMAPVLITDMMRKEYTDYIGSNNYEGLANMMLASSSQVLLNWVSSRDVGFAGKHPDNSRLSKFVLEGNKTKKKKKTPLLML